MTQGRWRDQLSFDDALVSDVAGRNQRLARIDELIDWSQVEAVLAPIYSSPEGQTSYPVLTLFKAQLLGEWYGLSDPALEAAIADRLSFRRFVGLPLDADVPDHSTLCRFRHELARRDVAEAAFQAVLDQIAAHGLMVKQGTLMDATLVDAQASRPNHAAGRAARSAVDPDADWTRKHGRSTFGYKMHVGVDEGSGLIRRAVLTPAKTFESEVADALISGDERAVYGDKAYEHKDRRARLKAQGIKDRIMHRKHKHQQALPVWQQRRNTLIRPVRAAVERVFGTLKRVHGYTRVRGYGLAINRVQMLLLATAYNLRRAERLIHEPA